ncbi:unnamed protein product, partial [Mesorhabditis belari]|uniref:Uncharacterized protein n=1 Tax=Mesorhabditis belari TaxID=2138241 RepID=A0AAF3J674_9BILA
MSEESRKMMLKSSGAMKSATGEVIDARHVKLVATIEAQGYQGTLCPTNSSLGNPFIHTFPKALTLRDEKKD